MALTQLRGTTQILDGSIPLSKLVSGYSIPTANLAQGSEFLLRNGSVALTGNLAMGTNRITGLAQGQAGTDAVNLSQVQALVNGISIKNARLISVTNLSLTGLQNFDGVTGIAGDIVLLTGQTTPSQNGLWTMNAGAWTRPATWAAASTQRASLVLVEEGTTYGDSRWLTITDGSIIVDTTATTWQRDTGSSYTNGAGLSLTGSTFAVRFGQGVEDDGTGQVRVRLDGTSLARGASGLRIANGTAAQVMMANNAGAATFTSITGDVSISDTGVTSVVGTIARVSSFIYNEAPTGAVNGVNTTFNLANTPVTGSVQVYVNGQFMEPGAGNDYTITGTAITTLFTLVAGDKIRVNYIRAS